MLRILIVVWMVAGTACTRIGFEQPADSAPPGLDAAVSDLDADDLGPGSDLGAGDLGAGSAAVTGAWSTPRVIRWSWQATGNPTDLSHFALVTAANAKDLLARSGSARVWSKLDNPELGHFTLPTSGASNPVVSTLTRSHQPGSSYVGQLEAVDKAGRSSTTAIVSVSTPPDNTHEEDRLLTDSDTKGYSIPSSFTRSTAHPYKGTHHYAYVASCKPSEPACWENLRRQGLGIALTALDQASFSSALYEFAIACNGGHSYWTDLQLRFGSGGKLWRFSGWTLRCDGSYQLFQVPLTAFLRPAEGSLPFSELAPGLDEFFTVGGLWSAGSWVHVDEIRIRW